MLLAGLAGCDFPRDAEGTLDRVTGGVLRVGISETTPWVTAGAGGVAGVEAALIRQWASQHDARIQWVEGTEASLIEALEGRALDLVLAGLTADSPWRSRIAFTQPYITVTVLVGVARGAPVPADWEAQRVGVDPGRPRFTAFLQEIGAVPTDPKGTPAAAVYDFELAPRDLVPTDAVLHEEPHVMAVMPGESASF